MTRSYSRRRMLRGMMGGATVCVGLPLFDVLFDDNGRALAQTGALPVRFGTWFWGCGMNPARWVPTIEGAGYDLPPELARGLEGFSNKVSVLTGFDTPVNGQTNHPHYSPPMVTLTGQAPTTPNDIPRSTFDVEIANAIGTATRFRQLDITADGQGQAWSAQSAGTPSPAESSPIALYQRVFGTGFQVGGSANFVPDPAVMVRKSVLSSVLEQSKTLQQELGSHDRQRLEQYFTSIRQLENQLDVLLREPPDLPACSAPDPPGQENLAQVITHVVDTHNLFVDLLALALACDQTRVFNINLWRIFTDVRYEGESVGYHQLTHDEFVDPTLGYQPKCQRFLMQAMDCWKHLLTQLDSIEEGDGTLLDHTAVFAHSGTEFPKDHGTKNIPILLAGSAGGKLRTGLHVRGAGSPTSRAALTLQQTFGLGVATWGIGDIQTSAPIGDLVAG
ncbi:MAG: DUF1552 domain-containing protein [Myxococcales bacterium]